MAAIQAKACPPQHAADHAQQKADLAKTEVREAVNAAIANKSAGEIHLLHKYSWYGAFLKCPEIVRKGDQVKFIHKENASQNGFGSKGAVVYSGVSDENLKEDNCGWLLAWQVPNSTPNCPNPPPNKVYVECRPVNEFARMNWKSIEEKLDESENESYDNDQTTRTEVSGSIDPFGSTAKLTGVFGLFN